MSMILRAWLYVPYDDVGDVRRLREQLSFRPRRTMDGAERPLVRLYNDRRDQKMIGVPQYFGRQKYHYLDVVDQTSPGEEMTGVTRLPDPDHPSVLEPERQAAFMEEMESVAREQRFFMAVAPAGSGKTVTGLRTAAVLGRKTLVVVHTKRIRDQWIEGAQAHLGMPRERIGEVGDGRCVWRDRDLVVAMVQTLSRSPRKLDDELYESFGTMIVDEVHKIGAPIFSQVAWQFPAAVRFGLTATDKRKDQGDKVYRWHLGPVMVRSQQTNLPIEVWPVHYDAGNFRIWGDTHSARMKCLTLDRRRNTLVARIVQKMYNGGRQTIVVSESIEHLQALMGICRELGVPEQDMGQFTDKVYYSDEVETEGRVQQVRKYRHQPTNRLKTILDERQVVFATYGMMKEGVDVPRLDAGIDATPRSDAEQLVGRIRRPFAGKKAPVIWVTPVDARCDRALRYYQHRLLDYDRSGAEVKHGVTGIE